MKAPLMKTRLVKMGKEDGQALVVTLLCLMILLGFVGLAADVGTLFYSKRQLQTAADSAALAGASFLTTGVPTLANLKTVAWHDAALNGVTNGTNGFTVTVIWPYTPANLCATCSANNYVQVTVSQTQKTFFQSLFTANPVTVAARAVALAQSSPGCMFTLDPSAANSFYVAGGLLLILNVPNCAIWVDSSSATALNTSGFIDLITAKSIGVVGGYHSGFFSFTCTGGPPCPATGILPVGDPLAYLPQPATGGCGPGHSNIVCTGNPGACTSNGSAITLPLSPGNYCGTFSGGVAHAAIQLNNATGITFQPGLYLINGGGATNGAAPASGGLSATGFVDASGQGVTFYLYNGASFNINPTVSLGSAFGVKFTAPLPGSANAGILFYQDRADISPAFLGGQFGFLDVEGTVYVPAAKLTFPAIAAVTYSNYAIYVAKNIEFDAFIGVMLDYATAPGTGGTSPIKTVVLTE